MYLVLNLLLLLLGIDINNFNQDLDFGLNVIDCLKAIDHHHFQVLRCRFHRSFNRPHCSPRYKSIGLGWPLRRPFFVN